MNATSPSLRVQRAVWAAVILLALIGVAIVARRTALLTPILLNGDQPTAAASASSGGPFGALDDIFARYPRLTLLHIIPGLLFVVLGPIQFSAALRRRYRRWHRWSGRVLLLCGLVIGGSALVMSVAMPAMGGAAQATATLLFGAFFLIALALGFRSIRRGNLVRHREWMIRAFSTGLAVATIRPIVGLLFATSGLSGLTSEQFFGIGFWLGFVLHLIAAEGWIRWTRSIAAAPGLRGAGSA
jgi:uncharacterized membrane protein